MDAMKQVYCYPSLFYGAVETLAYGRIRAVNESTTQIYLGAATTSTPKERDPLAFKGNRTGVEYCCRVGWLVAVPLTAC